jgi:hypothetical protein
MDPVSIDDKKRIALHWLRKVAALAGRMPQLDAEAKFL